MSNDEEVGGHEALLSAFSQQVPKGPERLPTLLEITRYPHYEDVCSNILAFYFDPGKPHGLGTLFLDAIACLGGIEEQWISGNVEVTREEETKNGKHIDILIRSASHAVLIENKIWHRIDNPFCDYAKHLDSLEQSHKHKFLLTLNPVEDSTAQECGFENITHEQLVKKIRERLGAHLGRTRRDGDVADTRYLTFMLDFLNTLDNLREGMAMDREFLEFLKSNQDDVESLLVREREFRKELRGKIKELERKMIGYSNHPEVEQWPWSGDREDEGYGLWDILVHVIEFAEDFRVHIDASVSPHGWVIEIWLRKGADKARLKELLGQLPYEEEEGGRGFVHTTRFGYDEDLKNIADSLQDVVSRLADARSSGNH